MSLEQQKGLTRTWFGDFVDLGAHLRLGGILYANWAENYQSEYPQMPSNFIRPGGLAAGFLRDEGYIQKKGNIVVWNKGHGPDVESKEFYLLFNKYSGRE